MREALQHLPRSAENAWMRKTEEIGIGAFRLASTGRLDGLSGETVSGYQSVGTAMTYSLAGPDNLALQLVDVD